MTTNTALCWLGQGPEHLPAYKPGGRLETFDIEELVAEGKAGSVCPEAICPVLQCPDQLLCSTPFPSITGPPSLGANVLGDHVM